jgi:hypothetical protein
MKKKSATERISKKKDEKKDKNKDNVRHAMTSNDEL